MNRRSFFTIAVTAACAGSMAGLGIAEAMPISDSLLSADSLTQSRGSLDLAGDEAHVEKAAVFLVRRPRRVVIVRRPRVVVRRRRMIRRLLRRL